MWAKARCLGPNNCSSCSVVCNHRIIECECCGDALRLRVQGKFPRIGFIDGGNFTFPCNPSQVLNELQHSSFDLFTFLQKPGSEGAKHPYPFELDNLAILPITRFEQWWERQIGSKVRNQVRRSEKKGVLVQQELLTDELVHAICDIYAETPVRQGRRFVHYGMTPDAARAYAGTFPLRSIFLVARVEGSIVGFAKMVTNHAGDYAGYLHLISYLRHRDKSVNNALIAASVRSCAARGIRQLGFDNLVYGKKADDSLAEFKINNGFQCVPVPRYYVRRNLRGAVAFRLGLHHDLRERIPESIASRMREIRTKWYARTATALTAEADGK